MAGLAISDQVGSVGVEHDSTRRESTFAEVVALVGKEWRDQATGDRAMGDEQVLAVGMPSGAKDGIQGLAVRSPSKIGRARLSNVAEETEDLLCTDGEIFHKLGIDGEFTPT